MLPEKIIGRKPSAGLWEGQTDEEELGMTYEELDSILTRLSKGGEDERVRDLMKKSEHKRSNVPIFKMKS
jgi:NAD+ synthase